MKKFPKDKWIFDALRRHYLVAREDGTIYRAKSASKDGVVDKDKGYRVVKFRVHPATGRVYFNMTWRGITKSVLVNRVIALRFLKNPDPEGMPVVNHIDGDKENNAVSNLEWSSSSDNERHAHRTGLKSGRGSGNSNAKLSVADIHAIRASEEPTAALAARYGVSRSTINAIIKRKTWSHV